MTYSGEFYCQHADAYVECNNKKCIDCEFYKHSMQKNKSNKKNNESES